MGFNVYIQLYKVYLFFILQAQTWLSMLTISVLKTTSQNHIQNTITPFIFSSRQRRNSNEKTVMWSHIKHCFTNICSIGGYIYISHTIRRVYYYLPCMYGQDWYVGVYITESSNENKAVNINFIRHCGSLLSWPTESSENHCWMPFTHVVCL